MGTCSSWRAKGDWSAPGLSVAHRPGAVSGYFRFKTHTCSTEELREWQCLMTQPACVKAPLLVWLWAVFGYKQQHPRSAARQVQGEVTQTHPWVQLAASAQHAGENRVTQGPKADTAG